MFKFKYGIRGYNALGYGVICTCGNCGQTLTVKNCGPKGEMEAYSYNYVSEPGDEDEGVRWRTFCDDCWAQVENLSEPEILDLYPPSDWEMGDSDKLVLLK